MLHENRRWRERVSRRKNPSHGQYAGRPPQQATDSGREQVLSTCCRHMPVSSAWPCAICRRGSVLRAEGHGAAFRANGARAHSVRRRQRRRGKITAAQKSESRIFRTMGGRSRRPRTRRQAGRSHGESSVPVMAALNASSAGGRRRGSCVARSAQGVGPAVRRQAVEKRSSLQTGFCWQQAGAWQRGAEVGAAVRGVRPAPVLPWAAARATLLSPLFCDEEEAVAKVEGYPQPQRSPRPRLALFPALPAVCICAVQNYRKRGSGRGTSSRQGRW